MNGLACSLIVLAILSAVPAAAKETGKFPPPDLTGYSFQKSWRIDADQEKDGINETLIEKFVLDERRVILKWTSKGRTWAWSVLNNYMDKNDNVNNYAIRDPSCTGIYSEKFAGKEQFWIPECAK